MGQPPRPHTYGREGSQEGTEEGTETGAAGAVTVNIGVFINTVISFLIVAFSVFLVIKSVNRPKKEPPPPDPTTKDCPLCCTAIPVKATRCPHCASELKTLK